MLTSLKRHFLLVLLLFGSDFSLAQLKTKSDSLLQIIELGKEDTTLITAYNELATELLGIDDRKALELGNKSLLLAKKLNQLKLAAWSYNLIGLSYDYLAKPDSALMAYHESINLKRRFNDKDGMASSYLNIGVLYVYQNDLEKALYYYNVALNLYQKTKNDLRIGAVYNNIGSVYRQQKKYTEAIAIYEKAYKLKIKVNDTTGMSNVLGNMGIVYQYLGQYQKAEELQLKSLQLDILSKNRYNMISSYVSLGELNIYTKNYKRGYAYLDTAVRFGLEINAIHYLDDAFKVYTQLDSLTGNYEWAFKHLNQYHKYRSLVLQEEKKDQLNRLETIYRTKENEQKIDLLNAKSQIDELKIQKQNRQIWFFVLISLLMFTLVVVVFFGYRSIRKSRQALVEKNQLINSSLEEKDVLLKEIHHRVKNNLQVVSSLLSLQSRYIQDPKALSAINQSKDRVRAISLLHQEIYRNEVLKSIYADQYFASLCNSIQQTYDPDKRITFEHHIEPLLLDIDQLIPFGLIVNELLTNAYKYATGNLQPHIHLSFQEINKAIVLQVKDNGPGLQYENLDAYKNSLGFKLVSIFVQKINAGIEIKNNNGCDIIIRTH